MAFAAIFVPNFMVQAAMRADGALRGRALALIKGVAPIWSVVGVNEVAARAGIRIGMTKTQAEQFRGVEIRHRSHGEEKAAHTALMDLGWSVSPRIEDAGADTVVMDFAGLNSLLGTDEEIAKQVIGRASALGLAVNVAVAAKIDVAILAARGFAGLMTIPAGEEAERLGPLPVGVLAYSIEAQENETESSEIFEILENWGIYTCEALSALPVLELSERLGQKGVRLHELARGASVRSLVVTEPDVHFEEEMELEDAVEELEPLSFFLARLLNQICARLTARSLAACAIRVRFELDPLFVSEFVDPKLEARDLSNSCSLRRNDFRSRPPAKIYERVLSLPVAMRDSKVLLSLLRLHLQAEPPKAPIVKILLGADAARPRVSQGELYLPSSPDAEKLELTVARLANVVGDAHVGSPELVDTHRPDEIRMRRFVPPGSEVEVRWRNHRAARREIHRNRGSSQETSKDSAAFNKTRNAFRVFRPAMPVSVELQEGCPIRVDWQGMRGEVNAASGPWRSSGDWWREDGWHNDEWDLEIIFLSTMQPRVNTAFDRPKLRRLFDAGGESHSERGVYRIYYDAIRQNWFVRGIYD